MCHPVLVDEDGPSAEVPRFLRRQVRLCLRCPGGIGSSWGRPPSRCWASRRQEVRRSSASRAQLYADPVVHAQTSRYQEIVLTRSAPFLPLAERGRRGTAENVTSDAESHRFARKIGFKVCRSGSVSLLPPGTSVPDIPSQPASP